MISDGSYLASTEGVEIEVKSQGLGGRFWGDSGGFFIMHASGRGSIAVSGFGSMRAISLDGSRSVYVDNGHLVAWDAALKYELALNTAKKGFFGKLLHSQTSGEGVVLKFFRHRDAVRELAQPRRLRRLALQSAAAGKGAQKRIRVNNGQKITPSPSETMFPADSAGCSASSGVKSRTTPPGTERTRRSAKQ